MACAVKKLLRRTLVIHCAGLILMGASYEARAQDTVVVWVSRPSPQNFSFTVNDKFAISAAEMTRMEQIIIREGYVVPWSRAEHAHYARCPHRVNFHPCQSYDRQVYLACVADRGVGMDTRALRGVQELCHRIAVSPSFLDRMRYR